jgi:hypothetical protein
VDDVYSLYVNNQIIIENVNNSDLSGQLESVYKSTINILKGFNYFKIVCTNLQENGWFSMICKKGTTLLFNTNETSATDYRFQNIYLGDEYSYEYPQIVIISDTTWSKTIDNTNILGTYLETKYIWSNYSVNIETIKYDAVSDLKMNKFVRFIKANYLQNSENCYEPKKNNIMPYFEGHNACCFFSFYYEDELLMSLKKGTMTPTKKLVGIMTTRPLTVVINSAKSKDECRFDVYYVDHLCVDKMHRKKGVAPQVIQTHHYNQRHYNRQIVVSLFKREDELTGIVPLCLYNSYGFEMHGWSKPIDLMPSVALVECGKSNIHHLFDFMKENCAKKFDICIQPEISNLLELIRSGNIYVYMVIEAGDVKSVYFYRKSCTFIREKCESLCCFASINCFDRRETDIFIHGYKVALWKICEKHGFRFTVIEETSDSKAWVKSLYKLIP